MAAQFPDSIESEQQRPSDPKLTRYFYLEHTLRERGRRTTKSKYLGRKLPRDIERVKREFSLELDRVKWFDDFDTIRRNYIRELRATPESAREKELHEFSVRFTYNTRRIEGSTHASRDRTTA